MKIELFVPHVAYEVRGLAVSGVVCLCALCALVLWACEDPLDDHRHSHSHSHSPRHRRDSQTPTHLLKALNLRRLSSCRTTSTSFLQASCS
jgi:hypothetical protein